MRPVPSVRRRRALPPQLSARARRGGGEERGCVRRQRRDARGHANARAHRKKKCGRESRRRRLPRETRCPLRRPLFILMISGQIAATPWQQTLSLCFWFSLNVDSHGERRTIYFFRIIIPTDQEKKKKEIVVESIEMWPPVRAALGPARQAAIAAPPRRLTPASAAAAGVVCLGANAAIGMPSAGEHTNTHNTQHASARGQRPTYTAACPPEESRTKRTLRAACETRPCRSACGWMRGVARGWRRRRRSARARRRQPGARPRHRQPLQRRASPATTTHRHEQCVFLCCFLPKDGVPVPICAAGAGERGARSRRGRAQAEGAPPSPADEGRLATPPKQKRDKKRNGETRTQRAQHKHARWMPIAKESS